jgi:hypothetical protein
MKKIAFGFCALILAISCQKKVASEPQAAAEQEQTLTRHCASQEVLERQLEENPGLRQRMADIERFTQNAIDRGRIAADGVLEIPVVVNVVYSNTRSRL